MATEQIKNGFQGGSDDQLLVNPDGSINVKTSGGSGSPSNVTIVEGGNTATVTPGGALTVTVASGTLDTQQLGLGAFQTSQYAIGTTAIQLAPSPLANRSSISITIEAAPNVAVYIGSSSSVTISNGYPLYDGSTLQLDLTPMGNVWAVSASAGQVAAILEIA